MAYDVKKAVVSIYITDAKIGMSLPPVIITARKEKTLRDMKGHILKLKKVVLNFIGVVSILRVIKILL